MGMQKRTCAAILLCVTVCFFSPKIAHGFNSYSSGKSMTLNAVQLAGIPRDLQLVGFDVSSWNELWDYVLRECRGYLSNTTHGNEVDTYRLALCLKAAMQELLGECFGNFPGVWDPIHCTFESFFSEEFVQTIFEVVEWADGNYTNSTNGNYTNSTNSSIDWTALIDVAGNYTNSTTGNYTNSTNSSYDWMDLVEVFQNYTNSTNGNYTNSTNSSYVLRELIYALQDFAQKNFNAVEYEDGNYTNSTSGNYTNSTNSSYDWLDLADVFQNYTNSTYGNYTNSTNSSYVLRELFYALQDFAQKNFDVVEYENGNYTNSTSGNYTNSTNSSYDWLYLVDALGNYTNSTNGNYTNSTNSSYDLRDLLDVVQFWRFYDYSAVLTPLQNLNSETCEVLFGTRDHPNFHACLHLFGEEDLTPFVQAAANGFKGTKGCSKLRETLNLGSRAFGKVSKVPKGYFNGFRQNFATCAKFDDGMLGKALTDQFVTGNAASTHLTLVVLILSALTAFVLM